MYGVMRSVSAHFRSHCRVHTLTNARMQTHTHTHTLSLPLSLSLSLSLTNTNTKEDTNTQIHTNTHTHTHTHLTSAHLSAQACIRADNQAFAYTMSRRDTHKPTIYIVAMALHHDCHDLLCGKYGGINRSLLVALLFLFWNPRVAMMSHHDCHDPCQCFRVTVFFHRWRPAPFPPARGA